MILPDASIWIDHFAVQDIRFAALLDAEDIVLHPMVLGELLLGGLPKRDRLLADLRLLPEPSVADVDEILGFIERHHLSRTGVGYVDAHLVASCLLDPKVRLWTRDKRLLKVAERLNVAADIKSH